MYKGAGLFALFLTVSFSSFAHEEHYVVQIAAVKTLDVIAYEAAKEYGTLEILNSADGINRVQLGDFKKRLDAERALKKVRALGFSDAFILFKHGDDLDIEDSVASSVGDPVSHPAWKHLTAEQRDNIVILDGIFHVKEGDEFVPLGRLNK